MPDLIFENPRLVSIYDAFDGHRTDLEPYVSIAKELGAKSILDIGCGTGSLATVLVGEGFDVIGVDPAKASLDFARRKQNADNVQWIWSDATTLPPMKVDLAMMTGNVAQVFITDRSWQETLLGIKRALKSNGHLVFEVRDPAPKAWLQWTREKTHQRLNVPGTGPVDCWCEIIDAFDDIVSFRWTYKFEADGSIISSDSKLRFRDREAIESSLCEAGFSVKEVRDAPDRPGMEFVFIAAVFHN